MISNINFFTEDVNMPAVPIRVIRRWVEAVAKQYKKHVGEISYLFCSDAYILEKNKQFLQHDYYTDIITFDNGKGRTISGDILISLDTVKSNAAKFNVRIREELNRVMIHGILHLCGIKDKTEEDAQKMRQAEKEALLLLRKVALKENQEKLERRAQKQAKKEAAK